MPTLPVESHPLCPIPHSLCPITMTKFPSTESGFTIVESIMAILVVAILLAAIAPVIGLSVANRAQAKRIEQGTNAARSYLDSLRTEELPSPPISNNPLEDIEAYNVTNNFACQRDNDEEDYESPYIRCARETTYELVCVDGDNDDVCSTEKPGDMILQVAGSHRNAPDNPDEDDQEDLAEAGYELGLRVYRAEAFAEAGSLEIGTQASTSVRGISQPRLPLWEMTTEMVSSKTNYNDLCDRIVDTENKSCGR